MKLRSLSVVVLVLVGVFGASLNSRAEPDAQKDAEEARRSLRRHLASLKNLSQALAARMIVELREKRYSAAWTNLLALTRLATAWEPEPSEISHLVRFNLARSTRFFQSSPGNGGLHACVHAGRLHP